MLALILTWMSPQSVPLPPLPMIFQKESTLQLIRSQSAARQGREKDGAGDRGDVMTVEKLALQLEAQAEALITSSSSSSSTSASAVPSSFSPSLSSSSSSSFSSSSSSFSSSSSPSSPSSLSSLLGLSIPEAVLLVRDVLDADIGMATRDSSAPLSEPSRDDDAGSRRERADHSFSSSPSSSSSLSPSPLSSPSSSSSSSSAHGRYANRVVRFHVVMQPNLFPGAARNNAVKHGTKEPEEANRIEEKGKSRTVRKKRERGKTMNEISLRAFAV